MNLKNQYRRLFENRVSSNDAKLLKENVNPKVQDAFDAVYQLTDEHGDSALELMDEYVESAGLTDVLEKFMDEENLTPKEATDLIDVLENVADELS